jgi:hypothetical protein
MYLRQAGLTRNPTFSYLYSVRCRGQDAASEAPLERKYLRWQQWPTTKKVRTMRNIKVSIATTTLTIFILLNSCSAKKQKMTQMTFELNQEDVGNIRLGLKDSGLFDLSIEITPMAQLEITGDVDGDFDSFERKYSGQWTVSDNRIILTFDNMGDEIEKIFDSKIDEYKTTKIIDSKSIEFDEGSKMIAIKGVYCQRTQ